MAVCAVPDSNGVLVQQIVANANDCTGFLLLTPEDSLAILDKIFDPAFIPAADYEALFQFGFTLPIFAYVVAWAYQTVISFVTEKES